jgi:hypothetical protein
MVKKTLNATKPKENVMSALRKNEMYEPSGCEAAALEKSTGWLPVVIVNASGNAAYETAVPVAAAAKTNHAAKNVALFLASPFIGLAYVVAMPFVAAGILAWMGGKALFNKLPMLKHVAMIVAAPFIGLAFVLAAPLVGIGALGWAGTKALLKH